MPQYPRVQPRRLRRLERLRRLVRETRLSVDQLIMPLFVRGGKNVRVPIVSMPGQFQLSVDQLVAECHTLLGGGIGSVLLFGVSSVKDERASLAYAKDGIVQQALRELKSRVSGLTVITDVCLCAYMSHGHCGVLRTGGRWKVPAPALMKGGPGEGGRSTTKTKKRQKSAKSVLPTLSEEEFWIDNDATLELLAKTAVSHAQAGADLVAPSDMMDGRVAAIRGALDENGYSHIPIMSYAAKFASSLYAPFREAADSAPAFGNRRSYQLDPTNREEALREVALDLEEGADIVLVKPALGYLDIIYQVKQRFGYPVAAFNVSGEYAMVKAASARGWLVERPTWLEMLLAIRRAGADLIVTYWAKDAAKVLRERA